jgi:hypothetical protein
MGILRIEARGSFAPFVKTFSAEKKGHAACIAEAISFLASGVLQEAIVNDHRCHTDGLAPSEGFAGYELPDAGAKEEET